MSQQEPKALSAPLNIKFANDPNLPVQHVNALGVNSSSDEFFITLGVVVPPDVQDMPALLEAGYITAQPVYRFAVSRDNMEKILHLMADQFAQQTMLRNQMTGKEIDGHE